MCLTAGGLAAPHSASPGHRGAAWPQAGSRTASRARWRFEPPACSERSREPISTANPGRAHAAHPSHAAGSPSCQRIPEPPSHACHGNGQSLEAARPSKPTEPGLSTPPEHFRILNPASPHRKRRNPASTQGLAATAPKTSSQPHASTQHHGRTAPAARAPRLFLPAPQRLQPCVSHTERAQRPAVPRENRLGLPGGSRRGETPHAAQPVSGLLPGAPQKQAPKLLPAPQGSAGPASAACGDASPALPAPHPSTGAGRRAPGPSASCPAAAPRSLCALWMDPQHLRAPAASVHAAELTPPRCRAGERLRSVFESLGKGARD